MGGDDADVAPPQDVPAETKHREVGRGDAGRIDSTGLNVEGADAIRSCLAGNATTHSSGVDALVGEPDTATEEQDGR